MATKQYGTAPSSTNQTATKGYVDTQISLVPRAQTASSTASADPGLPIGSMVIIP